MRTVRAGLMAWPATALSGCWPNCSVVATAGVMLNTAEVAAVRPLRGTACFYALVAAPHIRAPSAVHTVQYLHAGQLR